MGTVPISLYHGPFQPKVDLFYSIRSWNIEFIDFDAMVLLTNPVHFVRTARIQKPDLDYGIGILRTEFL